MTILSHLSFNMLSVRIMERKPTKYRHASLCAFILLTCVVACEREQDWVYVSGISVMPTSLTMTVGDTELLSVSVSPSNASNKTIIWTTDNADVAIVKDGAVTAMGEGSATVTAKSDDGGKTATCIVTVSEPVIHVMGVSLDYSSLTLKEGESKNLIATVIPANANDRSVTWSSSDNTVAIVEDGKVTAIQAGSAVISVLTADGFFKEDCTVDVLPSLSGFIGKWRAECYDANTPAGSGATKYEYIININAVEGDSYKFTVDKIAPIYDVREVYLMQADPAVGTISADKGTLTFDYGQEIISFSSGNGGQCILGGGCSTHGDNGDGFYVDEYDVVFKLQPDGSYVNTTGYYFKNKYVWPSHGGFILGEADGYKTVWTKADE